MRKLYFLGLALLISFFSTAQDLIITGVIDGPLSGGTPKAIELFVINDIVDLSIYGFGSANNGGGTDNEEFTFSGSATAGDYIYVASEATEFMNFFGFAPDFTSGAASINGDDAIELFNNGSVIDVFGDINVDGTGEPWEYTDGWAYRVNGTGPDGTTFQIANWTFSGTNALDGETSNSTASSPFLAGTFSTQPVININFASTAPVQVSEADGTVSVDVTISQAVNLTVDVAVLTTNDLTGAFDTTTQTLTFTAAGATTQTATFTFADNSDQNQDYYVGLQLTNNSDGSIGADNTVGIYVIDNETHAPVAADVLGMSLLTSFDGVAQAEIVTYDEGTRRLFVSNSSDNGVEIVDFSDPANPAIVGSLVSMAAFGTEVTSVSAFNGVVAVAVAGAPQANGQVVFIDTDGTVLSNVTVGALPDMVTFTPDGSRVLVANEGEPDDDYLVDPEGSIAVIDIPVTGAANITQTDVTILDFNAFDSQMTDLINAGVRIFGPGASVSQDLEPEFITVTPDNSQAFVALQENNAYAVVDLVNMQITDIESFGTKDMSLEENATDISNDLPFVFLSTWNVQMMRQPDAIANYTVGGVNYVVTANEGDGREYDGTPGLEEVDRGDDFNLDPTIFPNAEFLQDDNNLGRLELTNTMGDTDNDGDFDELFAFGARSFSIFNSDTGELVYDSADLLERITAEDPVFGAIFNTTDDENEFKNRSDDGGPEPEGVVVAEIDGSFYAFIGLERIGGIVVFDITDPTAPTFETYVNNRETTPGAIAPSEGGTLAGDLAPEGLIYIAPEDNATGNGLIVVANEVSATISVYELSNVTLSTEDFLLGQNSVLAYPNPVINGQLFLNQPTDFELYDLSGRKLIERTQASSVDVSEFQAGVYLMQFENGATQKIIIR